MLNSEDLVQESFSTGNQTSQDLATRAEGVANKIEPRQEYKPQATRHSSRIQDDGTHIYSKTSTMMAISVKGIIPSKKTSYFGLS